MAQMEASTWCRCATKDGLLQRLCAHDSGREGANRQQNGLFAPSQSFLESGSEPLDIRCHMRYDVSCR